MLHISPPLRCPVAQSNLTKPGAPMVTLATRMSRLGTENAFTVLARAEALRTA
ncbi:MAG: hypothetical protein HOJ02_07440, partial [Rhodospirillaceae bacterium]|nr:hypothetical protein [Rhodospirillaceae bacterium]